MENNNLQMDARGQWSLQVLGWLMVTSWFCASLLSQAMYMAVNGMPYGPEVLIAKLGVYYWIIAGIEIVIWALVAVLVYSKMRKIKQAKPNLMVPAR